jgi:hypothetical protein
MVSSSAAFPCSRVLAASASSGSRSRSTQFEQNQVVRVFLPNKRRRVAIAIAWQDMMDLEEVLGRNAENLNESVLNRLAMRALLY